MTTPYIPAVAPSKPENKGAATSGSQRDRRFTDTYFDNHKSARFPRGRPWTGERELAATPDQNHLPGFITADLQPGEYICENPNVGQTAAERMQSLATAWTAPWLPLAKYFKFNHVRKLVTFDYVRMENDEKLSLDAYYMAAAKLAGANGWGEIKYGIMPTYQVTALIGEPSIYLPIAKAARAGDPWLLGHIDEPNEELAKILGIQIVHKDYRVGQPMRTMGSARTPAAGIVTPDAVNATSPADLAAMIADAVAKAMAAKDESTKAANKAKMDRVRGAKKGKTTEAGAAA